MSSAAASPRPAPAGPLRDRLRVPGDPVADPAATVVAGQSRITVLSSRLLRFEWSRTATFEDRPTLAVVNRRLPVPPYSVRWDDGVLTLDTGFLRVVHRPSGEPLGGLTVHSVVDGSAVTWKPGASDPDNLRGTRRTLDNTSGPVALDEGLVSRSGWAVLDDSGRVVLDPVTAWVAPRDPDHLRDLYFIGTGHDYPAALGEYARVGGPVPLVPKFALGVWWSRFWAYTDAEATAVVDDFHAHGLPLDVLVLDMDWHRDGWTGYSWNRDLFPDPRRFLQGLHRRGVRVSLNLHPADGVAAHEDAYAAVADALGRDPASGETIPFAITDPAFAQAYLEQLHHPLEDDGVDFWWLDWQQGESTELAGLDPLPWLNHLHFLDSGRRGDRPLIFSRWGGMGNHRYQIGFSGDTHPTWEALRFQPEFTATAANVGYGWWSHDIGGHIGAVEPELYVRWVQFGAVSPVLRLHSNKGTDIERRPWAFGDDVLAAVTAALRRRYELLPYLYTYARVAADTGVSLCRPMYYSFPGQESAYRAPDQYLLGADLLAAPITRPADPATGVAVADVWIPPGVWYELSTGEAFTGPCWVKLAGDLNRLPVFARAGSVLPMLFLTEGDLPSNLDAAATDPLVLRVMPGSDGSVELYEDDGVSVRYRDGEAEWTRITHREVDDRRWELTVEPARGHCPALPRRRSVRLRIDGARRPLGVTVDGREHHEWSMTADPPGLFVDLPAAGRELERHVAIEYATSVRPVSRWSRRLAEARRVIPDLSLPDDRDTAVERLLAAPASQQRTDALALLGAPSVIVQPAVRPEAGAVALGHLVLAAPGDGSACSVAVQWVLQDAAGTHRLGQELTDVRADMVVAAPYAFAADEQPRRWAVHAAVTWRGNTWHVDHTSPVLTPSAAHWSAQVSAVGGSVPDAAQRYRLGRPLTELPDMTSPYLVSMFAMPEFRQRLESGQALAGTFMTVVRSDRDIDVLVELHAFGDITCACNDDPLTPAVEVPVEATEPLDSWWIRYVAGEGVEQVRRRLLLAARLRRGDNRITVASASPPGLPWWEFSLVLRDTGGQVLTGIGYRAPDVSDED